MVTATISTVKGNLIGAALGAGAGFVVAKKYGKLEKTWQLVASALVGGVVGAFAQSKIGAKKAAAKVTVTEVKPVGKGKSKK